MGSIVNGMSLSGLRAYGATFFIFSDYMRPVLRLAAMMDQPAIFIYTHDSFCLGEDGPTHQPIEHLIAVRAIPRLLLFRPADANEVAETWRYIMPLKTIPAALVLTRQAVPTFDRTKYAPAAGLAKGAYIMADSGGTPDIILMGTGSEVQLCVGAYEQSHGRRGEGARCLHAVLEAVRRAIRRVQAPSAAAGGAGARGRRSGHQPRLERVRRALTDMLLPGTTSEHLLLLRTC